MLAAVVALRPVIVPSHRRNAYAIEEAKHGNAESCEAEAPMEWQALSKQIRYQKASFGRDSRQRPDQRPVQWHR